MEQAQDTQEILADQTATEQQDNTPNDQIEDAPLFSTVVSQDNKEAQNEKNTFWLSWYNAIMLLSLSLFFYYFPRLIGFPSGVFQVTDFIAFLLDTLGGLLALLLLLITFPKIIGNAISFSILLFLAGIPRGHFRTHNSKP